MTVYCSTYCNQGHRLSDGKPVEHECIIIPPKVLEAERDGDYEGATVMLAEAKPLRTHRGCKAGGECR